MFLAPRLAYSSALTQHCGALSVSLEFSPLSLSWFFFVPPRCLAAPSSLGVVAHAAVLRLIRLLNSFLFHRRRRRCCCFFLSPLRGIIRLSCVDVRTHSYSRPRAFILVGSRREFRRRLLRRAVLCVLCMCTQQSVHSVFAVFCPEDPCFKRGVLHTLRSAKWRSPSAVCS